jgi:hypothetical protein
MKVCGFSFIKNGVLFDYPFEEAYASILSVCDTLYVAVGKSDDDTLQRVRAISPKIVIIETEWDENKKAGGEVFAIETDKAFHAIPPEYDWAFYIQGDEVLHQQYIPVVVEAMQKQLNNPDVDGLLFDYKHFFGSYDYVGAKYSWYRKEIRIIRNNKNIFSFRDAQGFRKKPNDKLQVKETGACIYHYGWVRNPASLHKKILSNMAVYKLDSEAGEQWMLSQAVYDYNTAHEPVIRFTDVHLQVMLKRISRLNWNFEPQKQPRYASFKDWLKRTVFKLTGWVIGEYKNYKKI